MKTLTFTLAALALTTIPVVAAPLASKGSSKDTVQVQTALSGSGVASRETNLGNLIADAVRQTGQAQIALVPADEIDGNAQIAAGKADMSAIISTLRYGSDPSDTVVVLSLTGAQLLKVAERSVSRAPQPFDGFLQVSGLQIRYSPAQPEGKRVSLVGAGGSEVDASHTYRVAVPPPAGRRQLGLFPNPQPEKHCRRHRSFHLPEPSRLSGRPSHRQQRRGRPRDDPLNATSRHQHGAIIVEERLRQGGSGRLAK